MKIIQLLLLSIFALPGAKAQDTDLDKFYFTTQEISFPKKIIPAEKRTYTYTGNSKDVADFNENEAIQLNGFTKSATGAVEVISGYAFGLEFAEQETRTRVDPSTKATFYAVSIAVKCDGRITVKCPEIDYKYYNLSPFKKYYNTGEFATAKQATDQLAINSKTWMEDAKVAFKQMVIFETNYLANKTFGYAGNNRKCYLWILGSKNHPEYQAHQTNFGIIKNAFATVKYTGLPADLLSQLSPALTYFDSLPKRYTEDSKKHKKMCYSAYYNQMKIYFLMDDLAKAEAYANLLIANDYDSKDGKKMLEAITERKQLWEANKATSSHFALAGESGFKYFSQE